MYYIYLIVNKVNGKTYVGQRESSKEWYEDKYMGSGTRLRLAKLKYGIENFEKFLIQYCYSKEETDKAERFWIAEYRSRGKAEYNIADGGQYGGIKGHIVSEETCRIISEKLKGKHRTEQQRRNISESHLGQTPWNKGKHCSEETKRKLSEANTGRHHTEETKRKMCESNKGKNKGRPSPRKGKHWKLVDGKRVWY